MAEKKERKKAKPAEKKFVARNEVKVTLKRRGPTAWEVIENGEPVRCGRCGRKLVASLHHVSDPAVKTVCDKPVPGEYK